MPIIARSCIEDIKNRVNLYDVVSPVVALKRSGRNYVGLSPFTNEKTPSFYVLPEKNIFKCFSSGHAGDLFRFVQLYEKLPFVEAVEAIANRFSLILKYEDGSSAPREARSRRKEILEIHEYATDFFHRVFLSSKSIGKAVRSYWMEERRFPLEIAKEHKIGLSPIDGNELIELLRNKGFTLEALKQCGLFYFREGESEPSRFRPRFRGRLMIPIRDYQGQVIAFTARELEMTPIEGSSRKAKYINSPETPVFNKSRVLFGLDHARRYIDEVGSFLLVEGQLDAIRSWQFGFDTAVAPQGTSITEDQLLILKRYADSVDCLLDGDEAGRKAGLRAIPMAFGTGLEFRFLTLPQGSDPDTLFEQEGASAIEALRRGQQSALAFAVSTLLPVDKPSPSEITRTLSRLFEMINTCELAVAQDGYLAEAADLLKIDFASARHDFRRFQFRKRRKTGNSSLPESDGTFEENNSRMLTTADYELLLVVFHYQKLAEPIAEVVDLDWIDDSTLHGNLLSRVLAAAYGGLWDGPLNSEALLENDEERDCIYSIMARESPFDDPIAKTNDCMRSLFQRYISLQSQEIEGQISALPSPSKEYPTLQRRLIELRRHRKQASQLHLPASIQID